MMVCTTCSGPEGEARAQSSTPVRVAIVSCYDKENYGSMLQAYATQHYLEGMGAVAVTVDKSGLDREIAAGRRSYYLQNVLNFDLYTTKMGLVLHRVRQRINPSFSASMRKRQLAFMDFAESRFHLSPQTTSFADLSEYCKQFDAVVVGSDQLWLPVNIAGGFFTLSFVPDTTRRVSFATSFGISSLPGSFKERTAAFLRDFDSISVREESGRRIVEDLLGRSVEVVCDPTMLLTPDQWQAIEEEGFEIPDEPYVLCYFLGRNSWHRECARTLADREGCKIVALTHLDEYIAHDELYADFTPYDVGPADFVKLVRNAQFVCTDSFHGSIFSVLFGRQFFSFRRHSAATSFSTNSRLDTLLEGLGLERRLIENRVQFLEQADAPIDFHSPHQEVAALKSRSHAYLRRALGCDGS
ncbi:MAG: polysaccharide pyruvyl transferase family protein [Coriobacteriia bacterium]|nr:polysaccharide pyruvyl transferase family protein [Coriobacteriia bacterium]